MYAQLCPPLCDPMDHSPPGPSVREIFQASHPGSPLLLIVVVPSLSWVRLFAIPWTAACQASLFLTISQSLLKLMSTESVMPSNHPVSPFFSCSQSFPASGSFLMSWLLASMALHGQSIKTSASASVFPMNIQD